MIAMITDIKRRSLHRLKILQGQLKGLEKMVEKEEYCMDILTQSLAAQKSLSSLNKLILQNHVQTHVKHALGSGTEKEKNKAIEELLRLYEINNVRGK